MDVADSDPPANGSSNGRFEGYSHYQTVSSSIAESIDEALSAYAELDSLHAEGAKVGAQQAARARSRIKLAALKLVPELREDAHHNEQYQQMIARWHGSCEIEVVETVEVEEVAPGGKTFSTQEKKTKMKKIQPKFPTPAPEEGYFKALSDIRLQQQCPDWLEDWVIDIRTAGWEIGYLQAGRSVSPEPELPDADQEFESMFADY